MRIWVRMTYAYRRHHKRIFWWCHRLNISGSTWKPHILMNCVALVFIMHFNCFAKQRNFARSIVKNRCVYKYDSSLCSLYVKKFEFYGGICIVPLEITQNWCKALHTNRSRYGGEYKGDTDRNAVTWNWMRLPGLRSSPKNFDLSFTFNEQWRWLELLSWSKL